MKRCEFYNILRFPRSKIFFAHPTVFNLVNLQLALAEQCKRGSVILDRRFRRRGNYVEKEPRRHGASAGRREEHWVREDKEEEEEVEEW